MSTRLPPWCDLGARSAPSRGPPSSRRSTTAAARTATAGSSPRRALGGGPCGRSWTRRASSRAAKRERRPQLLPGGGIRGAGRPAARRAREAPPQVREAERALGDGRHGVPHPRRQALPPPDNRLLRRHADELDDVRLPGRRDGELVAHGRMCPAQGGRASQGAQRPRLPLPLAGVDQDMRRPRHREVDAGEGCSPDNARAEGLFGRPKVGFLYGRDWGGVTPDGFADGSTRT